MTRVLFARGLAALAVLPLIFASPALGANVNIKDGTGTSQQLCAVTNSDGSLTECHLLQDTTGAKIDPATKQMQQSILNILGSPFQAGGSVGISGTLPGFAVAPTFNLGTIAAGTKFDNTLASAETDVGVSIAATTATTITTLTTASHGYGLQNNTGGACYWRVGAAATQDQHSRLLANASYYETPSSHVGIGILSVICASAGNISALTW